MIQRGTWTSLAALLLLGACATEPSASEPASSAPVPPWEPVDSAFAGCQGACGAHAEGREEGVIEQPGAALGQRTYCPVSGAVFEVGASHPHADVQGARLYFCCTGCAEYFDAHRDQVLRARRAQLAQDSSGGSVPRLALRPEPRAREASPWSKGRTPPGSRAHLRERPLDRTLAREESLGE